MPGRPPKYTDKRRTILELRELGWSYRQISEATGVPKSTVAEMLAKQKEV